MDRCSRSKGKAVKPEHLEEEDGHDELLGSRLEIELNRSIEKMREEELTPLAHLRRSISGNNNQDQDGDTSDSHQEVDSLSAIHNFSEELLEDIEMPNISVSHWESSDLISVSSVSPCSPVKNTVHGKSDVPSNLSFVVSEKKLAQVEGASPTQTTEQSISGEIDLYEQLASLSAPLAECVKTLISIDETGTNNGGLKKVLHSCDASAKVSGERKPEQNDVAANMTSSPVSSPDLHLTLGTGLELLDIDNMNDSLLVSSSLNNCSDKGKKSETFTSSLPPTVQQKVAVEDNASFSSGFLSEACDIVAELEKMAKGLSPSSATPDTRLPLHSLDMDTVNDSLLNSFSLARSPGKNDQHVSISSVPTERVHKKDAESKIEKFSDAYVKSNDCTFERLAKILSDMENTDASSVKSGKIRDIKNYLEETYNIYQQQSKGVNLTFDNNNDIHPVLNSTFEKRLESPVSITLEKKHVNTIFDRKDINNTFDKKDVNTTFDRKDVNIFDRKDANTTFDRKDANATFDRKDANTTFDRKDANTTFDRKDANTTFDRKDANTTFDRKDANTTFDRKDANTTFDRKDVSTTFDKKDVNTTFDKRDANTAFDAKVHCANRTFDTANAEDMKPYKFMDTTFEKNDHPSSEDKEKEKLNVTFERGEYKIASLNETVNLMDAEGDVLQIILDATPLKVSNTAPDAASTPKCASTPTQPSVKRTIAKDCTQSFLRRISLGMRIDNSSYKCEDNPGSSAQASRPVIPGMKMGSIDQQAVASQLRRLHNGTSSSVRSGPLRALPVISMTESNKALDSAATTDGLQSVSHIHMGDCDTGSLGNNGKSVHPSFGSVSSIENERPGTPEVRIITGIGMSTPDVFRCEGPIIGPRITSTPAMGGAAFSRVVGMEGPAPTPISAPSSRSRVVSVASTDSLPEQQNNGTPLWQEFSQESSKDGKMMANLHDQSTSNFKQISSHQKQLVENYHNPESFGQGKMSKAQVDTSIDEKVCTGVAHIQKKDCKVFDHGGATIKSSNQDIPREETAHVSNVSKNTTKNVIQEACDNAEAQQKTSGFTEKQKLALSIGGDLHVKSEVIDAKNLATDMDLQPKNIMEAFNSADQNQLNDALVNGEKPALRTCTESVQLESHNGKELGLKTGDGENRLFHNNDAECQSKGEGKMRASCKSNNKINVDAKTECNTSKHHKAAENRKHSLQAMKPLSRKSLITERSIGVYNKSSQVMQDKVKIIRCRSESPHGTRVPLSTLSVKDATDKNNTNNSALKLGEKLVGTTKTKDATDTRTLPVINRSMVKGKENKRKSDPSCKQIMSQVNNRPRALHGKKTPLRPVLGVSSLPSRRSLVPQPLIQKNINTLKSNSVKPNSKYYFDTEPVKLLETVETKKLKTPKEPQKFSLKHPVTSRETTDSKLTKDMRSSLVASTKGVPRSQIARGLKLPVDVNPSSVGSGSALKPKASSHTASGSQVKTKLPQRTGAITSASHKSSKVQAPKYLIH